MADLAKYIDIASIGVTTTRITGKKSDGASAAGYSAWVESITGTFPQIVDTGDNRAKVLLSDSQIIDMQDWIEGKLFDSLKPKKEKPSLSIEFGPVVSPLALKYGMIFGSAFFIGGFLLRGAID